ncbi:MAG: CPBP family glutamic-type intramembrane protease, partial [Byssovorax sp.]
KSDALTDLALTLPIFLVYHLGVALLPIRNAADWVTAELKTLAKHSLPMYGALTLAIGVAFAIVVWTLGRKEAFAFWRFLLVIVEGALYAVIMRFAGSYLVGSLRLMPSVEATGIFPKVVMALGAGFYEEVTFRVAIFGGGAWILKKVAGKGGVSALLLVGWAFCSAAAFSGWHYIGPMADTFALETFLFRMVCGLCLTAIFAFRGFAPAVWTHALYDIWVMTIINPG